MPSMAPGSRRAPPAVAETVRAPGDPLPAGARRLAEARFGTSFGSVRVHTDGSAAQIGADAYTVGEHMVFAPGLFAPHTRVGSRRLAHELTHVVQQRTMPTAGDGASRPDVTVLPHGSPAERQAQRVAVGGGAAGVAPSRVDDAGAARAGGRVVQRQERASADDAHYPDAREQRRIEEELRRDRPTVSAPSRGPDAPSTPASPEPETHQPEPVRDRGRHLTADERTALVTRLAPVLLRDLTEIAGRAAGRSDTVSEDDAMEVVERARTQVLERFGSYTRAITLTRDTTLGAAERRARNLVLVEFVDTGDAGRALARTRMDTACEECRSALADVDDESRSNVVGRVVGQLASAQPDVLRRAALKGVGGSHTTAAVHLPPRGDTGLGTAVHELIHELAHPAFEAAFMDERNIVEGFTEYFTRQIVTGRTNYQEIYQRAASVGSIVSGPFIFSGRDRGEESMRQAYFRGRLDLIGWVPTSPEEATAVAEAGGSVAWDPAVARTRGEAERAQDVRAQSAHPNILGTGLFFQQGPGTQPVISVQYARVLTSFDPLARGRLVAEGRVLASATGSPVLLGGGLGLAVEYQEPWFYATGGARLTGSGVLGLDQTRVDVSPFAGVGTRLWNVVRVGAEGFVLLPVHGSGVRLGAGASVGVEF